MEPGEKKKRLSDSRPWEAGTEVTSLVGGVAVSRPRVCRSELPLGNSPPRMESKEVAGYSHPESSGMEFGAARGGGGS